MLLGNFICDYFSQNVLSRGRGAVDFKGDSLAQSPVASIVETPGLILSELKAGARKGEAFREKSTGN